VGGGKPVLLFNDARKKGEKKKKKKKRRIPRKGSQEGRKEKTTPFTIAWGGGTPERRNGPGLLTTTPTEKEGRRLGRRNSEISGTWTSPSDRWPKKKKKEIKCREGVTSTGGHQPQPVPGHRGKNCALGKKKEVVAAAAAQLGRGRPRPS